MTPVSGRLGLQGLRLPLSLGAQARDDSLSYLTPRKMGDQFLEHLSRVLFLFTANLDLDPSRVRKTAPL